nr:hypothetical protein BaRGS_023156 [Batillaria attramentaria]
MDLHKHHLTIILISIIMHNKNLSQLPESSVDQETLDALDVVDDSMTLVTSISSLLEDDQLMGQLDNATIIAKYFRDPGKVRNLLVSDFGFSREAADALMNSQVNITAILELTGYPDLKAVACDPEQLTRYLYFPDGTDVTSVSRALCDINETRIPEITSVLQQQLNVAEIIRLLGLFESLKDRLNIPETWTQWLGDIADMLDLIFSIDNVKDMIKDLADITSLPDILRHIPDWVDTFMKTQSLVEPLAGLVNALDPLMTQFFPNDTIWETVKDGLSLAPHISDLLMDNQNVSYSEVMNVTAAFLHDLQKVLKDLSPEVLQMLDTFSTMDLPEIFKLMSSLIYNTSSTTLEAVMQQVQVILQETPIWSDASRYVAINTDILHYVNSIMKQLLDSQDSLVGLDANGELKQMLDTLMSKGPNVTLAVLNAFTQPDTLAVLLTEEPVFSQLCSDIIAAIASDIGQTTAADLNATLCYASMTAFNSVFDDLGISGVSEARYTD